MATINLVSDSSKLEGMLTLIPSESRQILMRPCVRRDLVAVIVSVFDSVDRISVVDAAIYVSLVNFEMHTARFEHTIVAV